MIQPMSLGSSALAGGYEVYINRFSAGTHKVPALMKLVFNSERQRVRYMNKLIDKIISARDEFWEENETDGVGRLRKDEGADIT